MNDLKGIIEDCNKSDLVSDKIIKKIIEIIGQEKWQDLHDEESDICTTIGELIITLNGIAELERKLEQTEKDLDDYQFNYPTINELEKENAELKAKNKWYSEQVCNKECAEVWGQLTNAKEIIKELNKGLDKLYLSGLSDKQIAFIEQLQDKAEQFLKEVEKVK